MAAKNPMTEILEAHKNGSEREQRHQIYRRVIDEMVTDGADPMLGELAKALLVGEVA